MVEASEFVRVLINFCWNRILWRQIVCFWRFELNTVCVKGKLKVPEFPKWRLQTYFSKFLTTKFTIMLVVFCYFLWMCGITTVRCFLFAVKRTKPSCRKITRLLWRYVSARNWYLGMVSMFSLSKPGVRCCFWLNLSFDLSLHKPCLNFWLKSKIRLKSETAPHPWKRPVNRWRLVLYFPDTEFHTFFSGQVPISSDIHVVRTFPDMSGARLSCRSWPDCSLRPFP